MAQACAVCAVYTHVWHADVAQSRGTMSRFLVLCGVHNTAWQLDTSRLREHMEVGR